MQITIVLSNSTGLDGIVSLGGRRDQSRRHSQNATLDVLQVRFWGALTTCNPPAERTGWDASSADLKSRNHWAAGEQVLGIGRSTTVSSREDVHPLQIFIAIATRVLFNKITPVSSECNNEAAGGHTPRQNRCATRM